MVRLRSLIRENGGLVLWERDRQLSAASASIAAAREGRGGALFILGEGGMGKTALLHEICRRAGDDVVVGTGRGDPMEVSLPLGVLAQVVHGLGVEEAPWFAPSEVGDARSVALYRTLRWLEDVARSPVMVALDDLQWADEDSLVFLGFLCRRLARLRVAVIASLRPWPPAAARLAWSLVNGGHATVERLLPLTEEAVTGVLAERLGGVVPPDAASRAWRLSGGNPLLLGLAAGAVEDGRTGRGETPLPADERSLVLSRFSDLSPASIRWAEAAAVLGVQFRPELVDEIAGLEGEAAEAAADAVWRSGLVRDGPNGSAEFVHPLFRQLLYEDLAPSKRVELHARAFTALTARAMSDVAAEHAIRANLAGDEKAVEVLTEAGRRALKAGAPATAASRLEGAVRLGGEGNAPLIVELGQALLEAGRPAQAASTITEVLDADLPWEPRIAALTLLSRAHFSLGEFNRAAAAMETATALAEQERPWSVVIPLCRHADALMMTAGPDAALRMATRARDLAAGGSKELQAQARAKWGMLAFWCGDPSGLVVAESEGRQMLSASRARVAADLRLGVSGVLTPFACAAMFAEHFEAAEAAFRLGIDEAERDGAVTAAAALEIAYGLMLLRTRLADSLAVADRLLGVADLVPLAEPFARTLRSYTLLELGEEEASAAERERGQATAASFGVWMSLLWLDHVDGLRSLRRGWFKDASDTYAELEKRYGELGIGEPCIVPYARHAVVAHAGARRTRDAERVVAWLDERAGVLPCRWPAAAAAAGRAVLALHRNDADAADKHYRTALEHLAAVPLPLEQAELMIEHGTMLRRDGRPREARELFRRAGELAQGVGAVWLARRAGEELGAAGGRRRTRRPPEELTPQEQRIARVAATGASDKDIASHFAVSVRTVRTHLEHIYAKLAIHSRRELMAMGERLEDVLRPKG